MTPTLDLRHALPLFLFGALGALGCSGSSGDGLTSTNGSSGSGSNDPSGFQALFDAPSGPATDGSILGIWGGTTPSNDPSVTFDTRFEFRSDHASSAVECIFASGDSVVTGVTVAARVSNASIQLLESKDDKKLTESGEPCRISVAVAELVTCDATALEKTKCFELSGHSLTIYGDSPLVSAKYTKLSD